MRVPAVTTALDTIANLRLALERLDRDPGDFMGFEGDVRHVMSEHVEGSENGEAEIPYLVRITLERYRARKPTMISPTMEAILTKDLGAVTVADDETFGALRTIYRWCHQHLPADAWGSQAKCRAWMGLER